MVKPIILVAMECVFTSSHSVPKASAQPTAEAANTAELK